MTARAHHPLPPRQQALMRRAVRLELWTIGLMSAVTAMVFLAAGNSQAMKTAWIEDLLSLVPPLTRCSVPSGSSG